MLFCYYFFFNYKIYFKKSVNEISTRLFTQKTIEKHSIKEQRDTIFSSISFLLHSFVDERNTASPVFINDFEKKKIKNTKEKFGIHDWIFLLKLKH